jgi:hypothetical protein
MARNDGAGIDGAGISAGMDSAGSGKKLLALALVVVGVATMVVGILGTVNDWGATETQETLEPEVSVVSVAPPQTLTSEPTTTPTTAATTTTAVAPTTVAPAETPQQFLTLLADGLAVGGNPLMLTRLHPAVIERYGEEQCTQSIANEPDAAAKFEVISVSEPATYAWTTDGLTTDIPDTLTVQVTRTSSQGTTTQDVHITPIDGTFRWFTDCGDPLPPS